MTKYQFSWDLIGNVYDGRPNLGKEAGVEMYRLMQYTLRDILAQKFGVEETDEIFFKAGYLAGCEFYGRYIEPVSCLDEFVSKSQKVLREKKIGILRIEEIGAHLEKVILAVDEDLDCSGLPELDYEICIYDEGFISALFECFTKQPWSAKEIDCWCTGARTCRFIVTPQDKR